MKMFPIVFIYMNLVNFQVNVIVIKQIEYIENEEQIVLFSMELIILTKY